MCADKWPKKSWLLWLNEGDVDKDNDTQMITSHGIYYILGITRSILHLHRLTNLILQ